jgi:hypothetical protein
MRFIMGALVLAACAGHLPRPGTVISPPRVLCRDSRLDEDDFCLPAARIEQLLRDEPLRVLSVRPPASGTNGAKTLWLEFPDPKLVVKAKWKASKRDAKGFNNDPRKELAAYAVQKLFLEPEEYVVPPTVGRCIPTSFYSAEVAAEESDPTFDDSQCVFGVLSYWLENVRELGELDRDRYASDPRYRRNLATLNLLTHLIDHRDTRGSNFVISKDPRRPRAFAVDNGLAFSGIRNPLAFFKKDWAELIVPSLPASQVERLRKLTRADLDSLLVVAQFELRGGQAEEVAPTAPLSKNEGVRRRGNVIQLGLTLEEIDAIDGRLEKLLERVDRYEIALLDDDGQPARAKR